jgi:hypothetical protein
VRPHDYRGPRPRAQRYLGLYKVPVVPGSPVPINAKALAATVAMPQYSEMEVDPIWEDDDSTYESAG